MTHTIPDRLGRLLTLWGDMRIDKPLREGNNGREYRIYQNGSGEKTNSALKWISIGPADSEKAELLIPGNSEDTQKQQYRDRMSRIEQAINIFIDLQSNSHIVGYKDHFIHERTDEIGWDILIRTELLTSLADYLRSNHLEDSDIIKMGIQICDALNACQQRNIIHLDVNPSNIFVSGDGNYKLGIFSIPHYLGNGQSNSSNHDICDYMAPEVIHRIPFGTFADQYSLGVVLYQMLNENRVPFMPRYPAPITSRDIEESRRKRIGGGEFPKPVRGNDRMWEIICIACKQEPKDRYSGIVQMQEELKALFCKSDSGISAKNNAQQYETEELLRVSSSRGIEKGSGGEGSSTGDEKETIPLRESLKARKWPWIAGAACILAAIILVYGLWPRKPVSQPNNIVAAGSGSGAVIQWDDPGDGPWAVTWTPEGGAPEASVFADARSCAISGLVPNTRYEILVKAQDNGQAAEYSYTSSKAEAYKGNIEFAHFWLYGYPMRYKASELEKTLGIKRQSEIVLSNRISEPQKYGYFAALQVTLPVDEATENHYMLILRTPNHLAMQTGVLHFDKNAEGKVLFELDNMLAELAPHVDAKVENELSLELYFEGRMFTQMTVNFLVE